MLMQMGLIAFPCHYIRERGGGGGGGGAGDAFPGRTPGNVMNLAEPSARTDEMFDAFQSYWKQRISC